MRVIVMGIVILWASVTVAAPALIEVYGTGCQPCAQMAPLVKALETEGCQVYRVNAVERPLLAQRYRVSAWPTFIAIEDGKELGRIVGVTTEIELRRLIRRPRIAMRRPSQPLPAWRYERPIGYRAAVVRVIGFDDRGQSVGSGVIIRWSSRVVVLTARHVIRDARRIMIILHNGRKIWARLLKVDATWDCAVLGLAENPVGVAPAELDFTEDAMPKSESRLESAGYGSDGKLAVNDGIFQRFVTCSEQPNGPPDWMMLSGYARNGDSGGPVFNANGRVVGILWGSANGEVFAIQPGRVHATLQSVIPMHAKARAITQRALVPLKSGNSLLPWRKQQEAENQRLAQQLQAIDAKLDFILQQQSQQPTSSNPTPPIIEPPISEPKTEGGAQTALGKLAEKEANWLAEHGGPLSSKLAAGAVEKLESQSAAVRFVGFTQAKAAFLVFAVTVLLILGLLVWVIHRINKRLLPVLQAKALATSWKGDDAVVAGLTFLHKKVDTLGEHLKGRLGNLTDSVGIPPVGSTSESGTQEGYPN